MTEKILAQEWLSRRERGSLPAIKLCVWIAMRLGRRATRIFLYPVCFYFLLSSPSSVASSFGYLARVLGRKPRTKDVFRHFLTFAACLLDRVYLLNEQRDHFDITVHDEQIVRDIAAGGAGCILIGAHFGSFEVARAIGRAHPDVPISLLMYEENAKKIRAALTAINPRLETEVIGLGRMDSLITVAERLARGHFIGVLADRNVDGRNVVSLPFLGAPASFPRGPFQVAMLLQRPVVLMAGVYRGGNKYEVFFETLATPPPSRRDNGEAWVDAAIATYAARLEHYCRSAPYNWFNFYNFWA